MNSVYIPVWERILITADEAAEYAGIDAETLKRIVDSDSDCIDFMFYIDGKPFIKRKQFEEYFSKRLKVNTDSK